MDRMHWIDQERTGTMDLIQGIQKFRVLILLGLTLGAFFGIRQYWAGVMYRTTIPLIRQDGPHDFAVLTIDLALRRILSRGLEDAESLPPGRIALVRRKSGPVLLVESKNPMDEQELWPRLATNLILATREYNRVNPEYALVDPELNPNGMLANQVIHVGQELWLSCGLYALWGGLIVLFFIPFATLRADQYGSGAPDRLSTSMLPLVKHRWIIAASVVATVSLAPCLRAPYHTYDQEFILDLNAPRTIPFSWHNDFSKLELSSVRRDLGIGANDGYLDSQYLPISGKAYFRTLSKEPLNHEQIQNYFLTLLNNYFESQTDSFGNATPTSPEIAKDYASNKPINLDEFISDYRVLSRQTPLWMGLGLIFGFALSAAFEVARFSYQWIRRSIVFERVT